MKKGKTQCICHSLPADMVHYPSMKKCSQIRPKDLIDLSNWEKKYDQAGFLKPAKTFILDLLAQQAAETEKRVRKEIKDNSLKLKP